LSTGTTPVIRCPYCQSAVIVPETLRGSPEPSGSPFSKQSGEPGDFPQAIELLRAGNKVAAIRLYKDTTGAGLKDSKNAVEEIEVRLLSDRDSPE